MYICDNPACHWHIPIQSHFRNTDNYHIVVLSPLDYTVPIVENKEISFQHRTIHRNKLNKLIKYASRHVQPAPIYLCDRCYTLSACAQVARLADVFDASLMRTLTELRTTPRAKLVALAIENAS